MYTYFIVLAISTLFVVFSSFIKPVRYVRLWSTALITAIISSIPFVMWDSVFRNMRIWGFTKEYLLGVYYFGLPIEEILFFIAIPFAMLFVYEIVKSFEINIFKVNNVLVFRTFFVFNVVILIIGLGNTYTSIVASLTILLLFAVKKYGNIRCFLNSYLLLLVPFLVVNGVLSFGLPFISGNPVVWYNGSEIIGIRILSIPLEDALYMASLLAVNVLVFEKLRTLRND